MSRDFRELGGRDAYALLGLDEDADAQEIKRAWRAMSRLHHADVGGSDNIQSLLNVAYDTLSDRLLRDDYDRYRRTVLLVGASGPPPAHKPPARPWRRPPPTREPASRDPETRESETREPQSGKPDSGGRQRWQPRPGRERTRRPDSAEQPPAPEPHAEARGTYSGTGEPYSTASADGRESHAGAGEPGAKAWAPHAGDRESRADGREPNAGVREPRAEARGPRTADRASRAEARESHAGARHVREPDASDQDEWDRWDYGDEPERRRFESEPEQGRHQAAPFNAWSAPRQADPRRDFISTARPVGYDNLAIVSLVLALVFAPAALVTAPMALYRIRRTGAQGRALAITALILVGVLTIALTSGYVIGARSPIIAR